MGDLRGAGTGIGSVVGDLRPVDKGAAGVAGYEKEVDWYLKGRDEKGQESKNGNAFNLVHEAPLDKLLTYCGMDSMFTYRLMVDQKQEIHERGLQFANEFLLDGTLALSQTEENGIPVDLQYYHMQYDHLSRRMKRLDKKVASSKELKTWNSKKI